MLLPPGRRILGVSAVLACPAVLVAVLAALEGHLPEPVDVGRVVAAGVVFRARAEHHALPWLHPPRSGRPATRPLPEHEQSAETGDRGQNNSW